VLERSNTRPGLLFQKRWRARQRMA